MKHGEGCPVLAGARQVMDKSLELRRSLRRLRRSLQACSRCPQHDTCQILDSFNSQVHAAILEVNDEWGLL